MAKKGKKKANGEGSIYPRKDGRYVGQFTDKQGKTRYIYGKTQKDVREKLTKALADRDNGTVLDAGNLTLGQHLDRWLVDSVRHASSPPPTRVTRSWSATTQPRLWGARSSRT